MPYDLHYTREKLSTAASILVTRDEPLRDRLLAAWIEQGHYGVPDLDVEHGGAAIPPDLADRIIAFRDRMSASGKYATTVAEMSDEEAADAAGELLYLSELVFEETGRRSARPG